MFEAHHNAVQAGTKDFYLVSSGTKVFDCLDILLKKRYVVIDNDKAGPLLLRVEMIVAAFLEDWLTPETTVDELAEELNYINPEASLNDALDILIQSEVLIGMVGEAMIDEDSLLNFWLSQTAGRNKK